MWNLICLIPEVLVRTGQSTAALTKLKCTCQDIIFLTSKIKVMCTLVISNFLYACEPSTLTTDIRCYHKILNISFRDYFTNEKVRKKEHMPLVHITVCLAQWRKENWCSYGHVIRSSGLAKTILQGAVPGGRRIGKQTTSAYGQACLS